jgi:N-glycosylase/DNA lyase
MANRNIAAIIEQAVSDVVLTVMDFQRALVWEDFAEYKLWRELSSCIIGSRVQFELARSVVRQLDLAGYLRLLQKEKRYLKNEKRIRTELRKPVYYPLKSDGTKRAYTFPNVRSHQLCLTAENIYGDGKTIKRILKGSGDEYSARKSIMDIASGVGPKQASLFLRNIGFANDLAILDSHVLRFMCFLRMLAGNSQQVGSLSGYERIEARLRKYSERLGIQLSSLDTAIWIVMRVYQKEFA